MAIYNEKFRSVLVDAICLTLYIFFKENKTSVPLSKVYNLKIMVNY